MGSLPTILCIESSGTACGVALVRDGVLVSHFSHWIAHIHDQQLAPLCQAVLSASNINVSHLDAVAVSAGPGSFTGLRIGVSLAKALCVQGGPRLIAVPTLEAVARASRASARVGTKISVIIPSQRDKYYRQHFSADAKPLCEVALLSTEELRAELDEHNILCGPGTPDFSTQPSALETNQLSAAFLVEPALELFETDQFVDPSTFVPFYVQDFVPSSARSI